jgi:hypothetical protein
MKKSKPEFEYPHFWHGPWPAELAIKMMVVQVWLARPPTEEERAAVQSEAIVLMQCSKWVMDSFTLASFGWFEYDVPREYGLPRQRAVKKFVAELDAWLQRVHRHIVPIRVVANKTGDESDALHRWSVERFGSSSLPHFVNFFTREARLVSDLPFEPKEVPLERALSLPEVATANLLCKVLRGVYGMMELAALNPTERATVSQIAEQAATYLPMLSRELRAYARAFEVTETSAP